MKTNVRNEDAITSAMGWLDQLREDGYAEPVSVDCRRTGHGRWPPAVARLPRTPCDRPAAERGCDRPAAEHRERQA